MQTDIKREEMSEESFWIYQGDLEFLQHFFSFAV